MTVEQFFLTYDPKVQEVCFQLRKIALERMPEMEEIIFEGWKNITYGTGKSEQTKT